MKPSEKCAVFGISSASADETAGIVCSALIAMQHRGKAMDNTLANNYKTLIEALALSYYEYKKSIADDEKTENLT